MIIIDPKNKKLKENYIHIKHDFEIKCKNYFLQVSKPYFKYLKEYFKIV